MRDGVIFDIKQFAVFDGPGIRQTVFFKGCPLHCSWCHNPEGQYASPQLMVSVASCIHCNACKNDCPSPGKCIACGKCIDLCPLHLRHIAGERITSSELIKRLQKDSKLYAKHGGGVTFSGGEPLMQSDFLIEVLSKIGCNMHRAIETSGFVDTDIYREMYSHIDYVIQDMKLFDEKMHIKYVGASNKNILANIEFLKSSSKPFVIRIPLIPGVSDTNCNLKSISDFLKGSRNLVRVELLPYLCVAGAKYQMIAREYKPEFDESIKPNINQEIFSKNNIRSIVL